jgi:hypothetical protein
LSWAKLLVSRNAIDSHVKLSDLLIQDIVVVDEIVSHSTDRMIITGKAKMSEALAKNEKYEAVKSY